MLKAELPAARIARYDECGIHAWVLRDAADPTHLRVAGSYCHDRWCVACANERSRRIASAITAHLADRRARFITLTLRHSDDPLADQLDRLLKSFARLRTRAFWRSCVTGGVACVELKWIQGSREWHPHIHCIVEGNFIPRRELSKTWHSITGDSFITDVRSARSTADVADYVAKYASKPFTRSLAADSEALLEAIQSLHHRRLVILFGSWSNVDLDGPDDDTEWLPVSSLYDIIRRAAAGERFARGVLARLQEHRSCPQPKCSRAP